MTDLSPALLVIVAVVAVPCLILLWWCPYFEARKRRHSKRQAIAVLTFFSCILWPLWIVAMVWAYTEDNRVRPVKPLIRQ